jgi:hypothetical protein
METISIIIGIGIVIFLVYGYYYQKRREALLAALVFRTTEFFEGIGGHSELSVNLAYRALVEEENLKPNEAREVIEKSLKLYNFRN